MSVRPYKNKKGELVPRAYEINCCPQGRKGKQIRKVIFETNAAHAKQIELALRRQHSQGVMPHDPKVTDVWPDWIKWYARDHAASTIKDISYAALHLIAHFGNWHLSRLTLPLFEKYLDLRHATLWAPPGAKSAPKPVGKSRINTEMKYMGMFIDYCVVKKYMLKQPFDIPRFKKLPKRRANLPLVQEVDKLLTECNENARFAVLLYHDSGLRRNEGLNIMAEDVFLDDGTIRVIGKGDKERYVAIGTKRLEEELRRRIDKVKTGLLMINPSTNAAYKDLTKSIKQAGVRAGVDKNLYNHLFRGVHASRLHEAGVELVDIQEQLGHEDIETTRKYITVTLGKRIRKVQKLEGYLKQENIRLRNMEAKKTNKPAKKAS